MRRWLLGVALAGLSLPAVALALGRDFEHPASNDPYQQYGAASVQRQDTPNDPDYDYAEPDSLNGQGSTNLYDERFDLFGFASAYSTLSARYRDPFDRGEPHPDGSSSGNRLGKPQVSGYNAAGAWKLQRGRPDVVVAILDTGVKWDQLGLRRQLHLNRGELPYPLVSGPPAEAGVSCAGYAAGRYDANGDGVFNVEDYACDPRVSVTWSGRLGPKGLITGQDLLHAFGDCQLTAAHAVVPGSCGHGHHYDNDGNGYANDIAGWNFFDNTNDPTDRSSYFAASNHGSGRASDAVEQGNDGQGSIGTCPHCQFIPVRVWDTFVSDANTFGLAMTYATDNGAKVIEGADGNLYHSAFTEAASQYAYDHGVVQTYSGDDLNTANHNYPANYSHAMEIQGTVPDTVGLGKSLPNPPSGTPAGLSSVYGMLRGILARAGLGTQLNPATYFRGANTTQYGGHSSISMEGPTGSINTGRASGGAGLVISAALDHGIVLGPDETREILEQTAERVVSPNATGVGAADLAAPSTCPTGQAPSATCATPDEQWTEHFGWGRADLGAAVALAASGRIPPQAAIEAPDWFAPLTGSSVAITGTAAARFATGHAYAWKLMWAPGLQPAPDSWHVVSRGSGTAPRHSFGSVDLNAVRAALAATTPPADPGGPTFAPGARNPLADQFTVQLEVTGAGIPTPGIDRRVFTAFSDPTLRPGFPRRLGTGGEAPLRYADLNGDNVPELVTPTEDGLIHAYEPSGAELPGWPVRTEEQFAARGHESSPALRAIGPPREPPRAPLIADLNRSGRPDVITAAGLHVYAWHGDGRPLAGFPVSIDTSHCGPALESQALDQHPKCGFLASPSVAYLQGHSRPPDIVAPGLDGWLYAWQPDGRAVPNFPVQLRDPARGNRQIAESVNEAAIGDLNHDGHDDIVVATNEEYGAPQSSGDVNFYGALASAAGGSTRVYAVSGATGRYLPGWPIAIPGIIQNVLPLVGPGNDPAIATIGGAPEVIVSATGGALSEVAPNGRTTRTLQQNTFGPGSDATDRSGQLNLFESASVGDLQGNGAPDVVKYGLSLSGAANLLLVGQNLPYNHLIGAYDGTSGNPLSAYPRITDDYQFLSASNVARLGSGPSSQVLGGTGLGLLHAYDGVSGRDLPGFPKETGGWLYSPAALSADGRMAAITREGYLFQWNLGQPPCQPTGSEWPSFRHDPHGSGNFNVDATPPAAPASVVLTALGSGRYRLSFLAPGDDGFCGPNAAHLRLRADGRALIPSAAPGPAGRTQTIGLSLASGTRVLSLQAVDRAGNVGAPVVLAVPRHGTSRGGGRGVGVPARAPRVALLGRVAFASRGGTAGVVAACLGRGVCRGRLAVGPYGSASFRLRAGTGSYLRVGLNARGRARLARSRRHRLAVEVSAAWSGRRARARMELIQVAPGFLRARSAPPSGPPLRALVDVVYADPGGVVGVPVGCFSSRPCTGSVSLGRLGGRGRLRLRAEGTLIVHFRLVRRARRHLRERGRISAQLTVASSGRRARRQRLRAQVLAFR